MTRNEMFRAALDYLYRNGKATDQKAVAEITGITSTTLSRIVNDHVKKPSDDTIRRLNEGFGHIFNPAYFRGETPTMLAADAGGGALHDGDTVAPDTTTKATSPSVDELTAQNNILELNARMIRSLDDLRIEMQKELAEIRVLKKQLRTAIALLPHPRHAHYSIPATTNYPAAVAEDSNHPQ